MDGWPGQQILKRTWVPLDKSEGETNLRRNAFQHRLDLRVVEDRSSETLAVNQLSAALTNRSFRQPSIRPNRSHDSSIRTPMGIGARAPNQSLGLACADQRHPRAALDTNDLWIAGIRA